MIEGKNHLNDVKDICKVRLTDKKLNMLTQKARNIEVEFIHDALLIN